MFAEMTGTARTAVVGVGATAQGTFPGVSGDQHAVRAAVLALEDAGVDKSQIDGLVTCKPPRGPVRVGIDENIGQMLGINPEFATTLEYGACLFSLHLAASAIEAGLATTVLCTYGTNQRSGNANFSTPVGGTSDWSAQAGFVHVAGPAAMAMRRHMHLYGTTEEQLGWVSVSQREWAQKNPLAIFRDPLTIDDYLSSPYVVAPLRRHDLTMISDGGAAFVLTAAERAKDFRSKPVYLLGSAQQSALRGEQNQDRVMRPWIKDIADRVYARSGAKPSDIDVAYLQDATAVWIVQQLEWYGLCPLGDAGPFLAEGHTRPGGSLPVNTHGGQLSESYMWNWMHLYELAHQLRGEAGERQVARAGVALLAQTHDFFKGAATIFAKQEAL
jgi:acetyl-CoA acetyltransferase